MPLFLVAAAIGHGGNHKRNNHTNHRQNLKISHDFFPLSPLLRASEGKAKSQAPSDSCHAVEPLPTPWLYFIILIYSCQSHRIILRYVCLNIVRGVSAKAMQCLSGTAKACFLHTHARNTRVHGKTCPTPIYVRAGRAV